MTDCYIPDGEHPDETCRACGRRIGDHPRDVLPEIGVRSSLARALRRERKEVAEVVAELRLMHATADGRTCIHCCDANGSPMRHPCPTMLLVERLD